MPVFHPCRPATSAIRIRARWRAIRDESGSSLIELALIVAFLCIPLILGSAQMSMVVYDSLEVSNAAHAGATYGSQSVTTSQDTSGITTAAQSDATDFGASMTVTPTTYYVCSNAAGGTQYTGANAQANATSACTGGTNRPLEFISVATKVTAKTLVQCPGLPSTFTLSGSSVMEVQE